MKLDEEKNKRFTRQYLHGSGFCGKCGEAINPPKEWEKEMGKCKCKKPL